MRDLGAVVQPAVTRAEAVERCRSIHVQILDGEAVIEETQTALSVWRLEIGKALVVLRATFGPRGDGFVECCEGEAKVPHSSAQRYMERAGYVARPGAAIKPTPASIEPAMRARGPAALPSQRPRPEPPRPDPDPPAPRPRSGLTVTREGAQAAPRDDFGEGDATGPRQLSFAWDDATAAVRRACRVTTPDRFTAAAGIVRSLVESGALDALPASLRRALIASLGDDAG